MKKFLGCLVVLVILAVIIGGWASGQYNNLVKSREAVNTSWAQVENVYQRRMDLIPNLVATVKGVAEFEKSTYTAVAEARAQAGQVKISADVLDDPAAFEKFQQSQGQLSSALSRLFAVAESYPQLKANQNFLDLQSQLEGTENRIDLVIEYRSPQAFVTILFFGLLILAVGNFALSGSGQQTTLYGPGVLWISFLFAGLLFLNHTVQVEKEENTFSGLLTSPATPGQIFTGKVLSAVAFLFLLQMILLPVFHVLFNFPFTSNYLWLALVILLASIGYCSLGILFSTMSLSVKNREMILSIILFPILIPLLIISVKASIILLNGLRMGPFYSWLKLLVAFDVIFVVLSYWSYFWIVEDV